MGMGPFNGLLYRQSGDETANKTTQHHINNRHKDNKQIPRRKQILSQIHSFQQTQAWKHEDEESCNSADQTDGHWYVRYDARQNQHTEKPGQRNTHTPPYLRHRWSAIYTHDVEENVASAESLYGERGEEEE